MWKNIEKSQAGHDLNMARDKCQLDTQGYK
jgi:hypothetical protein